MDFIAYNMGIGATHVTTSINSSKNSISFEYIYGIMEYSCKPFRVFGIGCKVEFCGVADFIFAAYRLSSVSPLSG